MTAPAGAGTRAAVVAESLAATYDGPPVLEDVSFRAGRGRTVGIIGPNGSGKTTLFYVLLGNLAPLSGTFSINGRVAYVPQHDRSRHDFPVSAHDVALMGCYGSLPWWRSLRGKSHAKALGALERLGLRDEAASRYGTLSGGQRQRVLIARALARGADIFLLDEPFSNIDPTSLETILKLIDELRSEGRTILITTHDVEQARMWDLVLCLNGKQIAFGKPDDVLTAEALKETYGSELIVIDRPSGTEAINVQHHGHD